MACPEPVNPTFAVLLSPVLNILSFPTTFATFPVAFFCQSCQFPFALSSALFVFTFFASGLFPFVPPAARPEESAAAAARAASARFESMTAGAEIDPPVGVYDAVDAERGVWMEVEEEDISVERGDKSSIFRF